MSSQVITCLFFGRIHPDKGTAEAIEIAKDQSAVF